MGLLELTVWNWHKNSTRWIWQF